MAAWAAVVRGEIAAKVITWVALVIQPQSGQLGAGSARRSERQLEVLQWPLCSLKSRPSVLDSVAEGDRSQLALLDGKIVRDALL